jgi:hypothetical protein
MKSSSGSPESKTQPQTSTESTEALVNTTGSVRYKNKYFFSNNVKSIHDSLRLLQLRAYFVSIQYAYIV